MNLPASWWWPLVLACLSVLDGGFAGYRDAAGRDGRVFKDQFYRRAVRRGLRHGLMVTAVVGVVVVALVATSQDPVGRLTSLLVPEPNSVGPSINFSNAISTLGPASTIPLNRAQNRFSTCRT